MIPAILLLCLSASLLPPPPPPVSPVSRLFPAPQTPLPAVTNFRFAISNDFAFFFVGLLSYSPRTLNGFGRVTQPRSSDLALTLTALIFGLACQQGSTNEDEETLPRDEPGTETISRYVRD